MHRVGPALPAFAALTALATSILSGCSWPVREQNSAAALGLIAASTSPSSSLEQIYYLGVFDPQEQLPPTLYRLTVRAQGSALNTTRYASGWVRSELIDSLSSVATFKDKTLESGVQVTSSSSDMTNLATGRRLVMFGPEGFREAPKDHRLVIMMGSNPEKFFQAVDQALGVVAAVTQGQSGPELERTIFRELLQLRTERERLEDLRSESKLALGVTQ